MLNNIFLLHHCFGPKLLEVNLSLTHSTYTCCLNLSKDGRNVLQVKKKIAPFSIIDEIVNNILNEMDIVRLVCFMHVLKSNFN